MGQISLDHKIAAKGTVGTDAAVPALTQDIEPPLYESHRKVYPQSVRGTYRTIKWIVLIITLGVYYFLPFVRWDRGPNASDQAVLIDFPARRFYFFFIEIWPQEFYYLTGLLVLAALILFLMNAVAGRVWCGYLCPQTVWTDLFVMVERFFEGDRRQRQITDAGPWTARRIAAKTGTHSVWLLISAGMGGAWVLYFADAPTLLREVFTGTAPVTAYFWIAGLTATTYLLAGFMREQVCIYMCPWPRIQAALTDEDALNVTYRYDRGEPRGSVKKNEQLRLAGQPAGDCVDCFQCVNVCPTGVDIRDGSQLGCIQCGLCIDACDTVMRKIGRPIRLIGYDTEVNVKRRIAGLTPAIRLIRVRTLLYLAMIALIGGAMTYTLATRHSIALNALHDRNPVFVRLADGGIRNAYTLRIINKDLGPRELRLTLDGLPEGSIEIVGVPTRDHNTIAIGPDQTLETRVLLTSNKRPLPASLPVTFTITDTQTGERAQAHDHFRAPEKM
jgi:cytochrome c oxidase accessory protein FixG